MDTKIFDLTDKQDVIEFMLASTSEENWNDNCDKVKAANNGYPKFWFGAIISGGVLLESRLTNNW